jgi:hypothetical protein
MTATSSITSEDHSDSGLAARLASRPPPLDTPTGSIPCTGLCHPNPTATGSISGRTAAATLCTPRCARRTRSSSSGAAFGMALERWISRLLARALGVRHEGRAESTRELASVGFHAEGRSSGSNWPLRRRADHDRKHDRDRRDGYPAWNSPHGFTIARGPAHRAGRGRSRPQPIANGPGYRRRRRER